MSSGSARRAALARPSTRAARTCVQQLVCHALRQGLGLARHGAQQRHPARALRARAAAAARRAAASTAAAGAAQQLRRRRRRRDGMVRGGSDAAACRRRGRHLGLRRAGGLGEDDGGGGALLLPERLQLSVPQGHGEVLSPSHAAGALPAVAGGVPLRQAQAYGHAGSVLGVVAGLAAALGPPCVSPVLRAAAGGAAGGGVGQAAGVALARRAAGAAVLPGGAQAEGCAGVAASRVPGAHGDGGAAAAGRRADAAAAAAGGGGAVVVWRRGPRWGCVLRVSACWARARWLPAGESHLLQLALCLP